FFVLAGEVLTEDRVDQIRQLLAQTAGDLLEQVRLQLGEGAAHELLGEREGFRREARLQLRDERLGPAGVGRRLLVLEAVYDLGQHRNARVGRLLHHARIFEDFNEYPRSR